MKLTLVCPDCGGHLPVDAAAAPDAVRCGGCQGEIPLTVSASVRTDAEVDACPVCEGGDFYIRKDFNPRLGVAVIATGALISAGFYWFGLDLIAYGVLGLAALIDLIVYGRLVDISVCYRCHAEFRGNYRRTAPIFDLHTADVLELEWARRLEARGKTPRRARSGAAPG